MLRSRESYFKTVVTNRMKAKRNNRMNENEALKEVITCFIVVVFYIIYVGLQKCKETTTARDKAFGRS